LNKLSKGLTFSIILHIAVLIIFTQGLSTVQLSAVKNNDSVNPIIQARLYFPLRLRKKAILTSSKEPLAIKETMPTDEKKRSNEWLEKTNNRKIQPAKLSKQPIDKNVLESKTSSKKMSQTSLEKLKQRLDNQARENAANDSLTKYLTKKSTVGQSITTYDQLAPAKAKIKEVDCNSSKLNSALKAMSTLLGGSIRCNSMPNLKNFLNKRMAVAEKKAQKSQ
jgi:hypothetical protein